MLAITAAILFALGFMLRIASSAPDVVIPPTSLLFPGLACLALTSRVGVRGDTDAPATALPGAAKKETPVTQVPGGQLSLRERARCHEVIRAQFGGYERCHRCTGHAPLPHHVRGRSWSGSWSAGTARVQFGVGCDDGCVFGDEVSLWGGSGEVLTAAVRLWKRRSPR